MTRVRMFVCAAAGLTLAAVAWCLPNLQAQAVEMSPSLLGRWVGVALLGIAMVAAGLVFRAAMKLPKPEPSPKVRLKTSEFRRGFARGDKTGRAQAARDQAFPPSAYRPRGERLTEGEVVVALRRAIADQAEAPPPQPDMLLPAGEVERLQNLLHSRAAELRARNAEQAKRRFMRSGVDMHGLARQ